MPAKISIQMLIIEDSPPDAELLVRTLSHANFNPIWRRVDSEAEYLQALTPDLDLILSDFNMPGFSGMRALELLQEKGLDIPFIMISGSMGEETAVEAIKRGSTDYLLKDRLARLVPSVSQALEHWRIRRESKRAQQALRESELRYRSLFDCAPDGIVILDTSSKFIDGNASICRMLGYTENELIGRSATEVLIEPDFQATRMRPDSGSHFMREWQCKRKDGTVFIAEVISTLLPNGDFLGMIRDITDRKRAEEQIEEQASLLDHARDGIFVRSVVEGNIQYWNKGAERVYGLTQAEALGKSVTEILAISAERLEEINKVLIQDGIWLGELRYSTKEKIDLTIESRKTLIRDKHGTPKSVLSIDTDVTERKKFESQLMRSQRMESIGTLAGGMAHDLNNILAPILLSIDLLQLTATDAESKNILETIEESAKRGADIVRQVLSYARGVVSERVQVQPRQLLKEVLNIIKDTFPKNIRIKFDLSDELWIILGDPTQLHQILLNLCVNARDAMPGGGSLSLSVENVSLDGRVSPRLFAHKTGRFVRILIRDTGIGIPSEIIDKIFEPFFTTKEVGKGTGLGLSTVLAIVKSHGGFVDVESEPGKGTIFAVYLPATGEFTGEIEQPGKSGSLELLHGNGELILVVDDEIPILSLTCQTLEKFGYRTTKAHNGLEAVTIYAQESAEIFAILTDMAMPSMDGMSAIRIFKKINPSVHIIAATGFKNDEPQEGIKQLENKFYINKPYKAEELLKMLKSFSQESE